MVLSWSSDLLSENCIQDSCVRSLDLAHGPRGDWEVMVLVVAHVLFLLSQNILWVKRQMAGQLGYHPCESNIRD